MHIEAGLEEKRYDAHSDNTIKAEAKGEARALTNNIVARFRNFDGQVAYFLAIETGPNRACSSLIRECFSKPFPFVPKRDSAICRQ